MSGIGERQINRVEEMDQADQIKFWLQRLQLQETQRGRQAWGFLSDILEEHYDFDVRE